MGPFHVAYCGGGTWVEVARHSSSGEIWASVEVTASDCFEDCGYRGAAHRLVCELDAVSLGSDGVCEETEILWGEVWEPGRPCL